MPVLAAGVVAAMVVGGHCCGSGGYASVVVVDVDGDDSDRDREKVIYYFNV